MFGILNHSQVHKTAEFICNLLLSGFCSGFIALILLAVYDHLRSGPKASEPDKWRAKSAFMKTVGIAMVIGMFGYIARLCSKYLGW